MFSKHELRGLFTRKATTSKLNFHESFSERGKFEFQKLLRLNNEVKRVNLSQFSRKKSERESEEKGSPDPTITFNQNERQNFVVAL